MTAYRKIQILLALCTGWMIDMPCGYAQPELWRAEVRSMFPAQTKNLWIHHMKGHIAGLHHVDFILGTDGQQCKGVYILESSKARFYFEGEDRNESLDLVEQTRSGRVTGFISGIYNGQNLTAVWTDIHKIQRIPVVCTLWSHDTAAPPEACPSAESISVYEGMAGNEKVKLFVRKNEDKCALQWYIGEKQYEEEIRLPASGRFFTLNNKCPLLNGKKLHAPTDDWTGTSDLDLVDNDRIYKLSVKQQLDFECYEFADFATRMELIKPKSDHKKFNSWLEQKFRLWHMENKLRKDNKPDHEYAVADRWKYSIYGWVEVYFFNNELISGIIYRQNSQETHTDKQAFIYDLSGGRELTLSDIFGKNFNAQEYINRVIAARKKEMALSDSLKKWADGQTFRNLALKPSGISCTTDFHPVFGELEIMIPLTELKTNIQLKSLLKELNND